MEKNGLELRRQIFHICLGVTILALLLLNILNVKILFIVVLVGLVLSLLSFKCKVPFVCWCLERFERKGEFPGKGALFFFLGCILVLLLFSKPVALASIAILTFGDSIAPLVGIYFGRTKSRFNGKRFVEGFVVGFIVASVAASFLFLCLLPCSAVFLPCCLSLLS